MRRPDLRCLHHPHELEDTELPHDHAPETVPRLRYVKPRLLRGTAFCAECQGQHAIHRPPLGARIRPLDDAARDLALQPRLTPRPARWAPPHPAVQPTQLDPIRLDPHGDFFKPRLTIGRPRPLR